MDTDHCTKLAVVDYTNLAASLFILLGILVSYIIQHIRIIIRRSSFGLSPYFVLLGTTSGTCAFANILILSQEDVECCRVVDGFACFAGLLGVGQMGVQWSCFVVILLLFLVFFPRATPSTSRPESDSGPTYRTAVTVSLLCVLHALIIAVLTLYFLLSRSATPASVLRWANFLGVFSTVLASIQYLPQIYTTYRLKRVGSLSIPMMCIQAPGSFIWAGSLAARLGPEGWSSWGVLVVTGLLQGTLLTMGAWFEITERRKEKVEIQRRLAEAVNGGGLSSSILDSVGASSDTITRTGSEREPTEQSPLLQS